MAEDARKADQRRRCNDEWLYCVKCNILVLKGQSCQEYLCRKSFDDNTAEYQIKFAEEDKIAEQKKNEYEARQAALAASTGSSSSGTLTVSGAIEKTWNAHLSLHVTKEVAYWETIKDKWGNDWEGDILYKLDKIYTHQKMKDGMLNSVPDGKRDSMLNLFRNTSGAIEKLGKRSEKEMLDNIITLLNEADNAGIFAAA